MQYKKLFFFHTANFLGRLVVLFLTIFDVFYSNQQHTSTTVGADNLTIGIVTITYLCSIALIEGSFCKTTLQLATSIP